MRLYEGAVLLIIGGLVVGPIDLPLSPERWNAAVDECVVWKPSDPWVRPVNPFIACLNDRLVERDLTVTDDACLNTLTGLGARYGTVSVLHGLGTGEVTTEERSGWEWQRVVTGLDETDALGKPYHELTVRLEDLGCVHRPGPTGLR